MAASQPNKTTMKEDGEDEMAGWWEKAAKKLREEDAATLKKKKEEELEEKRKEIVRASNACRAREQALVRLVRAVMAVEFSHGGVPLKLSTNWRRSILLK